MNISIIGSGWLAQPLARQLITDGHQLLLTTTCIEKLKLLQAAGFKVLQYELGDQLCDPESLFENDVVIVAITSKDIAAYDVWMNQLNHHGCKHLIYISSTSVYQNNQQKHDETSQYLNSNNPIVQIEQLIQSHPSATIIRFAGLVGPGRHPGQFFANGRVLKNPTAPVNLIHLDDCIGIIKAVINQNKKQQIFNGCADTHPTKFQYYNYMASLLNLNPPQFESGTTGSFKLISNQKIKTDLDYQLSYPDVMKMSFD